MSLANNLREWCAHRGLTAKPAVYLKDGLGGLEDRDARLVRFVKPADYSRKRRNPQKYTVEVLVDNEIEYPLGAGPMSKQRLRAAMFDDMQQRRV